MSEKMMDEFEAICESDLWSWMNEDQKLAALSLWESAWKASRAALVVELPEKAALMSASSVHAALDDAGVSYK